MVDTLQEIFRRKIVPIRFQRTMGLLGATTLGVGALMGAGIYVLIGLAADHAGPAVWLSYLLCGLLSFLSVSVFATLSKRLPITGGGYAYAYNTIGSFWGFLTGWLLALGSIFACAMYALGFAYYLSSFINYPVSEFVIKGIAFVIILLLTFLNCRGTKGGDRMQRILTWGNLLVLFVLIVMTLPAADPRQLTPMFPKGVGGVGGAIAIIYVSFFGYQLIANNSEEIIEPQRTVPMAMFISLGVSLVFYVAVALVSVMVVPWDTLAGSKAPLVDVALKGIGRSGWFLIAVGGVLASAAALNSTLLSQARQIFAMGKDRFLPTILGRIHEVWKTPIASLWAGGAATVAVILFGDLSFIVKSANFCFLTSMLPTSFAIRKLYRSSDTGERVGYIKRFIPAAAFLANLTLLFTLDWISIIFGVQLTAGGVLIYIFYSRKREIRSRTGMSVELSEERKSALLMGSRILVPVANPQTQPSLLAISGSLLSRSGGEVVLLTVVEATNQIDFYSALAESEDSLQIFGESPLPRSDRVKIRPVVRVSRSLSKGIVHAAEEEGCNLIVMGYAGRESIRSVNIMAEVLSDARTDTILFKLKGEFLPKRIVVSLGSSSNLNLIVRLAGALADRFGGEITFLNILPLNYTAEQKAYSSKILVEAIQHHGGKALFHIDVLSSDEPLEVLVSKSSRFDLLIVGTTKVGLLERAVVGPFASQIASRAECSVAVIRVAPPIKKLLNVHPRKKATQINSSSRSAI